MSRFEKRERDVEKLIQANENELKLTRSDCAEKQRQVEQFKSQLDEMKKKMASVSQAQESFKGSFCKLQQITL